MLFIREKYGRDNVIISDIAKASWDVLETGEFPSVSFFLFTYLVNGLVPVVLRMDNTIHGIKHYTVDSENCFVKHLSAG